MVMKLDKSFFVGIFSIEHAFWCKAKDCALSQSIQHWLRPYFNDKEFTQVLYEVLLFSVPLGIQNIRGLTLQ